MNITNTLVVDDDIAFCRILERILSREHYTTQTSQSVADALAVIAQKPFDVYVLDYKLPDGSGFDVAERIRSKWGPAPIVIISGYDPSAVALRAANLGISVFLEKPFSQETICNAVKKAIGSAKGASELSSSDSLSPAVRTHPISIPACKDVIGMLDTALKRDRLAGRSQVRFRFWIIDGEMFLAADWKTLVYIVLAIEAGAFVLLASAYLMFFIQILPK